MATNASYEYSNALEEYNKAQTDKEKQKALELMLRTAPDHKSSQKLRADIKNKIAKLKSKLEKTKKTAKKGFSYSLKKEGAATIVFVGTTNTGKSTLLKKLTGANVKIGSYEYTTKKPEIGIYDYHGIKLQIVEIPSIFENFEDSKLGPTFISMIKQSDLIILFFKNPSEKSLLDKELNKSEIYLPILIYNDQENIGDEIWKRLNVTKVRTKLPGKKPDYPPVSLKKGSTIKDLAEHVHKDFIKNFKFARIWGKSAKFPGARAGLNHKLEDDDIVELHLK